MVIAVLKEQKYLSWIANTALMHQKTTYC